MEDLNITISVISFILLVLGSVFARIHQWPLSEPLIAVGAGVLLGPFVLDVLDMDDWGEKPQIMLIATRFTIAMALMSTALRLPPLSLLKHRRNQIITVVGGMLTMWFHSTVIFWLLFSIDFPLAALAGAIITPTDPVIASSIVSGNFAKKHLSEKIRNTLSFESGANDGLAFPLVMLPLLLLMGKEQPWQEWILHSFLWETVGGIGLGMLVGYGAGKMTNAAYQKNLMTEKSLLASSLALSFLIIGSFQLINVNSIIGVFAAGLVFNRFISNKYDLKDEKIQETMERIFVIPIFFLFGLIVPFDLWAEQGWILLVLVVLILVFRRPPSFLVMKPLLKGFDWTDIAVVGWLGPIGVTSMFYVFYTQERLENEFLWTVASAIIFGSTLIHGITASATAKWYKRQRPTTGENEGGDDEGVI
uniref:Cation:proton antiporter n=1 Tax=Roseihalotalea indica TaxID=2867963 RepID=A0AA49GTM2_9BACT|nr:cation:proton antiporter [Tunicatimonas sp. TK19036]